MLSRGPGAAAPPVTTADIVIVGGGTAGCVLASRLSEDPRRRVVLLEAGPDVGIATPPDIIDVFPRAYANPAYFWPDISARTTAQGSSQPFTQARLLGGGSSVMGMWALRGLADDFDGWVAVGARGWSFAEVLPYFRKLEHDFDYGGPLHGTDGPISIRRIDRSLWPTFTNALVAAAESRGYGFRPDLNASDADGTFPLPLSADDAGRASSVRYLDASVRRRSNLVIMANCIVDKVLFDGRRATGIAFHQEGHEPSVIDAARVVVTGGAIHSPRLLMQSGVGPAADLAALGLDVIANAPGVGQNLQNHVFLHLGCIVKPLARHSAELPHYITSCVRLSSGEEGAPASDLMFGFITRPGAHRFGNRVALIGVHLYAPLSRGRIGLRRTADGLQPEIDFRLLDHASDCRRLAIAAQIAADLLRDPGVADLAREPFIVPPHAPVRALNAPGFKSVLYNWGLAAAAALPAPALRAGLKMVLGADMLLAGLNAGEVGERALASAMPMFHLAGTCALGSVLDPDTSVRGVERLYVADASAMPVVPRANTNIPTIMLAERAADLIGHA
jgi:5-(hydroxymethyl)furfural/furfural oxidase